MNMDKFKGKRMVHEDDKKYLEDLVYYHPDPAALWSGDSVTAGEGIVIEGDTISVDTEVVALKEELATVATTGDYEDLTNTPDLSIYAETADLATVAFTGDYDDLINKPTIPTIPVTDVEVNGSSVLDGTVAKIDVPQISNLGTNIDVSQSGNIYTFDTKDTQTYTTLTINTANRILVDDGTDINHIAYQEDLADKQDKLTAGTNITIDANNVISATNTTYTGVDYVTVDTTNDEIGLDATGKAAVDLVDGHMTESQGSITISDVNQINGTNYSLDADGYLVNNANGDIKFGTNNAAGTVSTDLYLISGGEGWYLETNNSNVSTSVAMDTTVMTQDTAYEFKQDGIYLNNNKITKNPAEGTVIQHTVSTPITVVSTDTSIDSLNLTPGVWVIEFYGNYIASSQAAQTDAWGSMSFSLGTDAYNSADAYRYPICTLYNTNGVKMSSTYKIDSNTTVYLHFWNNTGPIDYSYIFKAICIA